MARKKPIEELRIEQEKLEQEMKLKAQNLKVLKQKQAELERKERTHRLCTHAAILEQYLPPEEYTDEQINGILTQIFRSPDVIDLLREVKRQQNEPV